MFNMVPSPFIYNLSCSPNRLLLYYEKTLSTGLESRNVPAVIPFEMSRDLKNVTEPQTGLRELPKQFKPSQPSAIN